MDELERLRSRVAELEHAELERQRAHAALLSRDQQQAAVAKLGVQSLTVVGPDVLFSEAVCVVKKTLGVEYAKVLELLPGGEALLLRAGVGWRSGLVGQGTVDAGMDSQAGYTLASVTPVIVEDLRTETRFGGPPLLHEHGVVSGMSVVIHGGEKPFGVLGAHTRERRTFTEDEVHFLQAVANVLAATVERGRTEIERRRLEQREEQARQEAERAAGHLRELRAVSDPHLADQAVDDLLRHLLDHLTGLLQADTAAILLPDDDGYLVPRVTVGLEAISAEHVRIPPGKGIAGRIAASNNALVVDDLTTVEVINPALRASRVCSLMGVPLRMGASRGVLHAGTLAPRRFGEDDVRLLQRVADLVGAALNQMRSLALTRRTRATAQASSLLETARDEEATLQGVARLAVPDLADFCIVHAVGYDGRIRRSAIAHTDDGEEPVLLKATDGFDLPAGSGSGPLAEVIRTGQVKLIPVVDEDMLRGFVVDAEGQRHLAELGPKSAMVVPFIARGRTVGAMTCVSTAAARRYSRVDVALAEGLARHAAMAIDNARLFREAREAEARYRNLFERVGDVMILLGPDGRYLDANPAASDMLGYTRQEFRRMRAGDLVSNDNEWSNQQFERLTRDGSWRGEAELRRKDGSLVPAEGQAQQVVLPGGNAYIAIWRDISRRRAIEDFQREFLESVSHDLQTPLTALSAATSLLGISAGERLDPIEQELLANAQRNAERLRHLIADLLAYNELQSGTLGLDCGPVDLRDLVNDVASSMNPLIEEKGQELTVQMDDPLVVEADRGRFEQVLTNIVINAHRHTPSGTRIAIAGEERNGTASLEVRDTGPGIPSEHLENIFRRFHRLSADENGSGLGLAISRQLVELHGGRIWAENAPGGGSVFRMELPKADHGGSS